MWIFYYAMTDENDVLCVDQLDDPTGNRGVAKVAELADRYPEVIYFGVEVSGNEVS